MKINQLRSKYNKEIEIIREKVQGKNLFISVSAIDEIIGLLENLHLEKSREIRDAYLEKLLDYAIKFCETADESLINERHIKQAILDVNKIEVDLMRKVITTEGVELIEKEKEPEKAETLREIKEEQTEEFEFIQEEEVPSALEEIPTEEETLHEEITVSIPKKEHEQLITPIPQITNCPFCGLEKSEEMTFCPQCGMIFKK